jgi:hypothetical protein
MKREEQRSHALEKIAGRAGSRAMVPTQPICGGLAARGRSEKGPRRPLRQSTHHGVLSCSHRKGAASAPVRAFVAGGGHGSLRKVGIPTSKKITQIGEKIGQRTDDARPSLRNAHGRSSPCPVRRLRDTRRAARCFAICAVRSSSPGHGDAAVCKRARTLVAGGSTPVSIVKKRP